MVARWEGSWEAMRKSEIKKYKLPVIEAIGQLDFISNCLDIQVTAIGYKVTRIYSTQGYKVQQMD